MVHAASVGASALSPLFGGFIIKFFNFPTLFIVGSVLLFIAMIPLFLTKETYEKLTFSKEGLFRDIFQKNNSHYTLSFAGYAVESWIGFVIWLIFLFTVLFTIESVGVIVSLTTITTLLIFYFIGKATDKRDKRGLLKIGTFLYFFGWVGRMVVNNFVSIFFVDTYKSITRYFLYVPWSAYSYDLAAKANYFKFIVRREIIFNLTRTMIIPFLILIFVIDYHPFRVSFLIAALFSLFFMTLNKKNRLKQM
ncbi:major Facilitator Superfamily protein [bacterium BMS3Abin15]|nr:major Facilitator Superfamily protein [bacterium BMS3Abin15]